ncbi:Vegetative incompatibility protein HET-E-1 [Fusarium oxysporum f. sp. narcissi]|uniref:Vegetative incompatibility protein HET-E-1 n=1 Tax=Fusarium oxysporum f. sp. narcissi TaxID=451672 RepID=A0A4Q2V276_FUSOX|nr:Vegetative incompatibility protein HET-E-1 [Fusarium oxysporum f. sp. narcissi]
MKTRLESPDLYTIGWITALPIELAAVTAFLDEHHVAPEGFEQRPSDTNSYTWGRIGEHNVVIASLPAGVYGITSAATTASNLIHSLPHIRIGLLVGIGGGIARPDLDHDIRLGDVVVSQPDSTTGGVVQYDFGKAKANGAWERKGSLDKPPLVLLSALGRLQAQHERAPSKIPELLQKMLEANPYMKRPKKAFTYQGAENDRLFESQHDHVGGSNCDKCDLAWEVKRDRRESTDPEIHYGVIASGNTLIKDAATRDSLLEDTGHQCFCVEMEAAGLMDRFPCLVIRGICDYADSHKNDRWQRYAAATAAAFAVELLDYVPVGQLEASRKVIEVIQSLDEKIFNLEISLDKIGHHISLDHLPNAEGASFDSHAEEHNPTCLANTRVELLRDIDHWIDDATSKAIFWLNGMAGTGKSTIARTIAQMRHKRGDLGASFFFKRGETDRGSLAKFVPTVARRLAWNMPEVAPFIKNAVDADPAIADKAVREQFEKLFREPLSKAMATSLSRPSVVIVVDALDECENDTDIKCVLELFSTLRFACFLHVRVLVTSRPELPVRLGFSSIEGTHQDLILHEIPQSIIKHDIAVFLRHEFNSIRENFNNLKEDWRLPVDWPTEADLIKLTMAAVPLFIYAATICRFVNDSCLGNPDKLLQSVLHHTSKDHASKLDMTYSPVLKQQVVNRSGRERRNIIENFRLIVGTITTLASPLSVRALALLLDVHIDEVTTRLRMLHSVLEVPDSIDSPVRLLHLSFRDYLVDLENKETIEFWVDEKLTHRNLVKHCLRVMRGTLRKNICSLSFPGMHRSAVSVRQIGERIPPELQYACMNWVHHQTKVDLELNDMDDMYDFLETHFLHWLEVLSLVGRISESTRFIDKLQGIVDPEKGAQVLSFLRDAKRFVLNYRWIIDTAPLQLYASALVFAPKQSIMRQTFERFLPRWISLLPNVDSNWNAVLQTLESHTDLVSSVVFSNNGKLIASGSCDNTVKIWNVEMGKEERTLVGHTDSVRSVVFSKDSKLIASGSDDKTVKIWNVATGEEERTLEGHTDPVNSVVFSKDGKLIASGSWDKTIKIWNAMTGEEEQTLRDHRGSVSSVVFSKDSKLIASGSWDNTVKIWNVETGKEEQTLEGHTDRVSSVVFSKDGKLIASGSWDETIKIWNVATGEEEQTLEGHTSLVTSVVFSKDGKLIASGSWDKTVKIWNVATGEEERTLKGHTDSVSSVVFSKDSKLIASGSYDKTVKIWNVATGKEERTLEGHTNWVRSVVFSNDGKLIASGSVDETVKIWNVATGINVKSFDTSRITNVLSFTDDDSLLVTSVGRFSLGFRDVSTSHSSESEPKLGNTEVQGEMDAKLGFGINRDKAWITAGGSDGRKVLWLPPNFRPGVSATLTQPSGSVIVIGSLSGRVVIMGFGQ